MSRMTIEEAEEIIYGENKIVIAHFTEKCQDVLLLNPSKLSVKTIWVVRKFLLKATKSDFKKTEGILIYILHF